MPHSPKLKRASNIKQIASRPRRTKIEEWDEDDDGAGHHQHEEPEDFATMLQRRMSQEEHAEWLASKTSLAYETVQNKCKELVKTSVFAIDEIKAASGKFRAQETDYEKYHEDHQLTEQRQKEGFSQVHACFAPILEDLGRTRSYDVNATSELVKNNPSNRQEILRNFSKTMRSRFEEAKKKEKEIEDAEALIQMVKKILYF